MSECISGWVMLHGDSAVIEDIYADARVPANAYRPTFVKSLAMVPIRVSDPIGAIGNYWASRRCPTEEEVRRLEVLANSTSIAMENVQLYRALEERVRERSAALDAAREAEATVKRELEERERAERQLRDTEEQLRQAQKMEAIGRLAGGVAHDFNNLLSVILSLSHLSMLGLEPGDPLRDDIGEIRRAGERAAALTRQLLAFSRQQVVERRPQDLNEIVSGMENMVARLIGTNVELEVRCTTLLHSVLADAGQLEQVLMNLVVNARDAMPGGGSLTIETKNATVDAGSSASHRGVAPGDYAVLTVTDTGVGMSPEVRAKIFEPFFTTKAKGVGTGLGLSTAYGIVTQAGGHIGVRSEPDMGASFEVYLPKHSGTVEPTAPQTTASNGAVAGTETVLLVEDDDQVRAVALGILRRHGYDVLESRSARDALLACEQYPRTIHLLLTDVVMAQMSGLELAERLKSMRPDMRVLSMSGFTDETALHHGLVHSATFIQKPFTPDTLLTKVRQVLDA